MPKKFSPKIATLAFIFSALLIVANFSVAKAQEAYKHNPNMPIDIIADDLEVRQDQNIAIFRGAVEAKQGSLILMAETLTVYYKDQAGEGDAPIGRIDAAGNVRLSSPNESADGHWAVYDVERQIITLGGDVTLRQKDSLLTGNRLELNLLSGVTKFAGTNDSGEKSRVKGRFSVPK
jgi:lipopolysaccharide export system protein LptA